ncbi:maleylacetate reductase [Noviherbaspirillum denitrificans]|uniref:Uncharacterized protein n=1 Tax=Noviherbaspirillum denitrificans TaxID=1968433 RepID=A0A254TN92_9BURK|nr:maleylacetate reductase [Noviherbaspirillum denitrificans]OWW21178.1 hypothetical protein AYR66_18560 [Noviherbaspirillum denitrificans]
MDFTTQMQVPRIVFAEGALARLPDELARLGPGNALLIATPRRNLVVEQVRDALGSRFSGVFPHAAMHVPAETVRAAVNEARRIRADCLVAIGGGSPLGLAKAVAREMDVPIVAIPTTYAGSEMTSIFGITESARKTTGRDPRVLPKVVIYDPLLSVDLPVTTSVSSGFNAMAHAVEGMYAADASPLTSLLAAGAVRALKKGLLQVSSDPHNLAGRADCLYGAALAGIVLGSVSMGLHHQLCHVLGGTYNLLHAELHAVLLPHVLSYNAPAAPAAAESIAGALDCRDAALELHTLAGQLEIPRNLQALGVPPEALHDVAVQVAARPYMNPRLPTENEVLDLLQRAYIGNAPGGW